MSSGRLEVLWSPIHPNKFVLWGPDISLYEVSPIKEAETKPSSIKLSSKSCAQVIASQNGWGIKSLSMCGDPNLSEPLLALGHSNAKVTLTSLGQNVDSGGLVGREYLAGQHRICNSVSWSPVEHNLLAVALDKNRNDHCILLWDVHRDIGSGSECRPIAEMGLSETAQQVTWAHSSSRTLIAAMNMKYIKIFDLRDLSNKAVNTTTTRYCHGISADPHNEWRMASRGDGALCVWDARNFQRPLVTLPQPGTVAKLLWCPTRANLLCSLQKDTSFLRLHDIQNANYIQTDTQALDNSLASEVESSSSSAVSTVGVTGVTGVAGAHVVSRDLSVQSHVLQSFSWHYTRRASVLTVTNTGNIMETTVPERVSISWGAGTSQLVWGSGSGELRVMPEQFYETIQDISCTMKRRTDTEYGLKTDLWQNADLADDEALSNLWHFLALSKSLVEDGCIRSSPWRHPGVRGVLKADDGGYRSEAQPTLIPDMPSRRVTIYKSASRACALQLCSWGWGWENVGLGLERAEAEGAWGRAAALATFHLRLRTALDVLARAPPEYRVVALALAGLSDDRLWRDVASAAGPSLPDPYLRAMLAFLAASSPTTPGDLQTVLNETEMRLEDRVAFACIFLSDAKLQQYVDNLTDSLIRQGDLSGILLTGASPDGISLLQKWVEITGDVQSAALVAARTFTPDLLSDPRSQHWIQSYRQLLDSWKLWWSRCALDTWLTSNAGSGLAQSCEHAARQVMIACGYCSKTVASPGGAPRPRAALARAPVSKMKQASACPHCRKPLPRCSVCALHLGAGPAAPLRAWLTWCAACRHAGHAQHLLTWFREHTECPISSCNCRCITLDPLDCQTGL